MIAIGTWIRGDVDWLRLSPPYIAPQATVEDDIGENYIGYRSLVTILDTQATVATLDDTVVDNHIVDRVHVLTTYLHRTASALHHTVGHHDIVARTILLKLTAVFQADGIITTGDMAVGNAHVLAMVDVDAITITYLEIVEKIDSIYHRPITTDEVNGPIGTFTNGDVTDMEVLHTHQGQDVRTRIESGDRLQLIAIKKFSTHKLDAIAMNRTMP